MDYTSPYSPKNFPALCEAAFLMDLDNGHLNRTTNEKEVREEFVRWLERSRIDFHRLRQAEYFLEWLSEEDLQTFVGGEHTEVTIMSHRSEHGRVANWILNAYFERLRVMPSLEAFLNEPTPVSD